MIAAEHSEDVTLGDGAGIAEFTLWGTGQEPHESDYLAMATLTLVPWQTGYARIVCDVRIIGSKRSRRRSIVTSEESSTPRNF